MLNRDIFLCFTILISYVRMNQSIYPFNSIEKQLTYLFIYSRGLIQIK